MNEHVASPFPLTAVQVIPSGELYWNRVIAPLSDVALTVIVTPESGTIITEPAEGNGRLASLMRQLGLKVNLHFLFYNFITNYDHSIK